MWSWDLIFIPFSEKVTCTKCTVLKRQPSVFKMAVTFTSWLGRSAWWADSRRTSEGSCCLTPFCKRTIREKLYSKAPSYTAPRCTDPADTRFFLGPKFFQIHGFPNIGHSFTPQLHGYEFFSIIKKVTRFLSYTVFQNTLKQCTSGPYCMYTLSLYFSTLF